MSVLGQQRIIEAQIWGDKWIKVDSIFLSDFGREVNPSQERVSVGNLMRYLEYVTRTNDRGVQEAYSKYGIFGLREIIPKTHH
jgi:hypothetical protein